jgi:energy-coupling factor transporter ATP-binding protein EcfA2
MITLDQVSKQYKSSARPALDNISVKIDKGEFVFLIGPSGSGKSTFMRLLLAEEHPSSGDIRVSKFRVNKLAGSHPGPASGDRLRVPGFPAHGFCRNRSCLGRPSAGSMKSQASA